LNVFLNYNSLVGKIDLKIIEIISKNFQIIVEIILPHGCRSIGMCLVNGRKFVKEVSSSILTPPALSVFHAYEMCEAPGI